MSMLARFVQISPEELSDLVADPSAVGDLVEQAGDLPGSFALTDAQREQIEREAPQCLEQSLAGLEPSVRAAVEQRLEELTGGTNGSSFLDLMARRGLVRTDDGEPGETPVTGDRRSLSLDKAWHGVHYLLSGRPEPRPDRWGRVVLGGTELGDDEFGFGPARYFDADEVAEISADLARPELEADLGDRFDPARMTAFAIYPGSWQIEDREWLLDGFRELRNFLADAAGRGAAVVTCLV